MHIEFCKHSAFCRLFDKALQNENSDYDLAQLSTKYDAKDLQIRENLIEINKANELKLINKVDLVRSNPTLGEKTTIKNIPKPNSIDVKKYRELNFDYPEWRPNDLEISKKTSDKSKYLMFQEKDFDINSKKLGKTLNIKL